MWDMWDTLVRPDAETTATFRAEGWWRAETFLDDLARAVDKSPQTAAIIAYENGKHAKSLTYRELSNTVERFAAALLELGVERGDVVVVYLPNWWMLTPLYLACGRIGAVVAPTIPAFAQRELGHVLRESRAKVCIVPDRWEDVDYAQRLAEVAPDTLAHQVVIGDVGATGAVDFAEFFERTPWEERHRLVDISPADADDPALLLFTSGTTGVPKGVAHSHNTLYASACAVSDSYRLGAGEVITIPHFLTHMAGASYSIYMSLLLGGTCVMQDTSDMSLMLDIIAEHQVTFAYAAPLYVTGMIAAQRDDPRDVSTLRYLVSGSAPIPPQLVADARDVLGVELGALWGMTENGGVTVTRPEDPPGWAVHSDGSAVPAMQIRIDLIDGDELGRLLVRGAAQCLGYVNQRDVYQATLEDGDWFDTGDMARPDGRGGIKITGRRVDLITLANAAKVPALEIEAVILRHPRVTEVALIGYPDPDFPSADCACAVIVAAGEPITLAELTEHLKAEQVTYENWPSRVEVVDALPKNSLGKVLRPLLRTQIENQDG
jgi:cyclohexanecarboxylate-CoA ligase